MKLSLKEIEIGNVYQIPENTIITESEYHRLTALNSDYAVELWHDEAIIGFAIKGELKVLADVLIHTNEGAEGKSIDKTVKDIILLTGKDQITSLREEFVKTTPENSGDILVWVQNSLESDSHSLKKANINIDNFDLEKERVIFWTTKTSPSKTILVQSTNKLVVVDSGSVLVRKGDDSIVTVNSDSDENSGVVIVGDQKRVKIGKNGNFNISINGKSIGEIIGEALDFSKKH